MEIWQFIQDFLFGVDIPGQDKAFVGSLIGAAVGIGGALLGGSKAQRGARWQKNSLINQREEAIQNQQRATSSILGAYRDYTSDLRGMARQFDQDYTLLDIDRSQMEEATGAAGRAADRAEFEAASAGFGRMPGEDIAREEARRSTANTLGVAQRAAGSSADLLGALALSQMAENSQMRSIDQQTAMQRENQRQAALNRREQATRQEIGQLGRAADFEAQATQAETASRNQFLQGQLGFQQQLADVGLQVGLIPAQSKMQEQAIRERYNAAIAGQNAAITNSQVNMIGGVTGALQGFGGAYDQWAGQNNQMGALGFGG